MLRVGDSMNAVSFSADIAALLYTGSWLLLCSSGNNETVGLRTRRSNLMYALGAAVMGVHILLAYAISHQFSHAAALEHTADETHRVVGLRFAAGLYVNFVFLFIYVVDAYWRWKCGTSPLHRTPKSLAFTVDGFLIAIVLMATIVFEGGWIRYAMLLAIAVVIGQLTLQKRSRTKEQRG